MEEVKKKNMPPLRATIRFNSYPNEVWKKVDLGVITRHYMVSNMGRIASYLTKPEIDGYLLKIVKGKGSTVGSIGLKRYEKIDGKTVITPITLIVNQIVATAFIPNDDIDKIKVINLDYDGLNNSVSNLRWATREEVWEHIQKNPTFVPRTKGPKLTVEKVRLIKRKIAEGKTKQSILAKQFGLSEMGIYRIKSGKNWRNVTI
jgi:hypothetical protein